MDIQKQIYVYADWPGLGGSKLMGVLKVSLTRGKEIFNFEYDDDWLKSAPAQVLDPDLRLYTGPQYLIEGKINFGIFLDSSPDRWGRLLMKKREAATARKEGRTANKLYESDFLLGVFDGHRMGALRFKLDPKGDYLDNNSITASPPWAKLRDLEYASMHIEEEEDFENPEYLNWLRLLVTPGSSLGGARPKSSVIDTHHRLWIAKFPGKMDQFDIGAWEMVVHELAIQAGITVPEARLDRFSSNYHTYLNKRFDRTDHGQRIHFASALTLLGYTDGTSYADGASYMEIAEFIIQNGARVNEDLKELWKRIVLYICVSNTDDHLRNHGFILTDQGWVLSPAYDINPVESGSGLSLNISEDDNSLDLDLVREVAGYFRIDTKESNELISSIKSAVRKWKTIATDFGISKSEQERMSNAFNNAEI
jgi:serine/threonine-protein kinase HipA